MVLFSYKKRVPFLIPKGKDGKRMKKIKMFMGAVLCMNLLTLSGCDRIVQSAVVEEKDQTEQKKEEKKEISEMEENTKVIEITGMMCGHCEARVKKSLEALDQVQEAVVSHETGTAVVTLKADVDDSVLKKTVEDQDYKVTSIQ